VNREGRPHEGPEPDPAHLSDAEIEAAYLASRRRVAEAEAESAVLLGEIDRRGLAERRGFLSTTAWVIALVGTSAGVAAARVRLARRLRKMPLVRRRFLEGDLEEWRVRSLANAHDTSPDAFARDEELLTEHALSLSARDFPRAIAYWRSAADERAFARDAEHVYRRRRLFASRSWGGVVKIDGELDPESGEVVIAALRSLTDPDRGRTDGRSPAQQRADALVDLCRRHLDDTDRPIVGGERPHLTVTVELETLEGRAGRTCEIDAAGAITPEAALRLACDAGVSRIITRGKSQILDVGRRTRTVPPALRRALDRRDRGCTQPGCGRPPAWCDAHHRVHWARGGPTRLDNLVLLCRRHHREVHEGSAAVRRE
jgi:hypothetical protein